MPTAWFCLVSLMLAVYVVLDGFDLGAGIIHLFVARGEPERRQVLAAIGPVWDGNEVWLLAGGGTLYFAFPGLYAASFSGFYLPLMVVLWLLILRGVSIEFRNHIESRVWKPMWDTAFAGASALLAVFFGAALGNVIRGVPLDGTGFFFLPFWTDFTAGKDAGILDWYTVSIGLAAFVALTVHGALWVALKTEGQVERRARRIAERWWWPLAALTAAITLLSFRVQPQLARSFRANPWGYVFPVAALAGLAAMRLTKGMRSFLASCLFLAGMLTSAAFGIYPYVLPAIGDPNLGLTVYNTAAAGYGLGVGMAWFIPGMLLASGYFAYTYRSFAGKVRGEGE